MVKAIYVFRADHFVSVVLSFSSKEFDRLSAIFIERYGAPTSEERQPYKTQGGLATTNQILRWSGPTIAMSVKRYGNKITEGIASITTQEEVRESMRLRDEQLKGAAKGL